MSGCPVVLGAHIIHEKKLGGATTGLSGCARLAAGTRLLVPSSAAMLIPPVGKSKSRTKAVLVEHSA